VRAILTYHSIDASGSVISVEEHAFRAHVAALATLGVRGVTVGDLLGLPPDANAVAFTFDDGYANFATAAWPVLDDAGFAATVFVVTDHVGGHNAWDAPDRRSASLDLLGWDALAGLAAEGVMLEAHSRTHPDLRGLSPTALEDEMEGSAERIARECGRRPEGFAYPYGALDAAAVAQARRSWKWACTTELATLDGSEDPHCLPRLDAYYLRRADAMRSWDSPRFHWRLRIRALARRARAALFDSRRPR
jgi:peptidoglycan/xylan/chitin deacetylase (PgdA/CDA1 family)